ncbi:MAG: right-handed parallel beta-helix repeat-containing protein [Acidimicrobiales bacterium]
MSLKPLHAVAALVLLGAVLTASAGMAVAQTRPRAATTLWVAPKAKTTGESASCSTAKYRTIPAALAASTKGDTVEVCAGTYTASTTIKTGVSTQPKITTAADVPSGVSLVGQPGATIDAAGLDNGVTFFTSVGASVSGFAISGATGEGILALLAVRVTIDGNVVEHNDTGSSTSSWYECQAAGEVPSDCGEGIHLMSSSSSKVHDNTSAFNSGGILLSDDFGPTHSNVVNGNLVEDNESDCGITVVGHNSSAVSSSGKPQPSKAGTYDNTISNNQIISNGTTGDGGGVLLASAAFGGGSYDNTVTHNEIAGNGLSGVTIHQHAPLSDVSGDVIEDNWIGTNDISGDPGTGDSVTTGVLLDNGGVGAVISVTIEDNTIAWDTYGIYDDTGGGLTASGNKYIRVTTHLKV